MARAFWPDSTAVGQRLIEGSRTVEVVGVVRDVQLIDLGAVEPAMFMPRMLAATVLPQFLVRSDVPPDRIRGIIGQLESRATVTIAPLADTRRQALNDSYTGVTVSWMLGGLALVLAVGGVFGVFSYLVEEADKEIGIRGARRPARPGRCRAVRQHTHGVASPDWPSLPFSRLRPARRFAAFSTA